MSSKRGPRATLESLSTTSRRRSSAFSRYSACTGRPHRRSWAVVHEGKTASSVASRRPLQLFACQTHHVPPVGHGSPVRGSLLLGEGMASQNPSAEVSGVGEEDGIEPFAATVRHRY